MQWFTCRSTDEILHDKGDPAKRARRQLRSGRLPTGFLKQGMNDRIELRVELFNPTDGSINEFERRCLACSDQLGLSGCIEIDKGIYHSYVSLRKAVPFCIRGFRLYETHPPTVKRQHIVSTRRRLHRTGSLC